MLIRALVAWLAVATLAPVTNATAACWIERERPTTADQLPIADARVAGARAAAKAMNAILKGNAALQGLPEVRLRSTWQVTGHPRNTPWSPYGVHLILWAHPKSVWGPGQCDVIPQADRVDPRAAIVISSVLDAHDYPAADAVLPKPFTGDQVRALVDRFAKEEPDAG
jgi:hypothetical protein